MVKKRRFAGFEHEGEYVKLSEIKEMIEKFLGEIWLIHEFYSKYPIIGKPNCGCDADNLQKLCNDLKEKLGD